MVKTPRTRHSRTEKKPVTIDLAPDEVSRLAGENRPSAKQEAKPEMAESTPAEPRAAEAKKPAQPQPAQPKAAPSETAGSTPFGRQEPGSTASPLKDKKAPEQPPSSPPSPPGSSRRRSNGLLAGLAGGVAALALAAALQFYGILPLQPVSPAVTDHGPAIAALESELGKLRTEIAALNDVGRDDAAFTTRLNDTEKQMAMLAAGLESLRGKVAALEPASPAAASEMASANLTHIEEKIAAVEAALARLPDMSASEAAIAALQSEVKTIDDGQDQAASRLDALEAGIAALTGRVDEQEQAPATAIIIAASSLKAAIDRGTPFTTELDTYAALVPDAPQLGELRALAAAGVPTRAQLAALSDAAANAMIAASRPVDPQAGITDRLWNSMMGLVQVRPIGMVEGDGVPEIVARFDAAVQAGDYQRALAEYDTLPPEAKAAGEGFIARLRARDSADQLVDAALAAALKA